MGARFWLYLLLSAVATSAVTSGVAHISELGDRRPESPGPGSAVLLAGLVALAVAVASGLAVARSFLEARRQLARQAQVIAAAGSMSRDWLWESDLTGKITYSSPGVTDLLGFTPEEVVGRFTDEFTYDEKSADKVLQLFRTSRHTRAGWDHTAVRWRDQNGDAVLLHGAAVPLHDQRGRVIGYRGARRLPAQAATAEAMQESERRIESLLNEGGVQVALQPLVSLISGRLVGAEALARFSDGRSPEVWFREASECGHTVELDNLTFTAALGVIDHLPPSAYLSVNASPELLLHPDFPRMLVTSNAPLQRLVIEITEHARVKDYSALGSVLDALRGHGVRFAVDDTGAGYSSLNHVLQLRPDMIKLDRGLLTDLAGDPARRSLITALVLLALEIGASVTGEGVEDEHQLEALTSLGVDHAQGYLLAHPSTDPDVWQGWVEREWRSVALGR